MHCFLWGHVKEHVYATLARSIEDQVVGLQADVTTVSSKMLRHVPDQPVR
jgi:hypothetical protein